MNQAVFLALMQPGDTFMGLDLAAGGHLTHGSPVNMSRQVVQGGALRRARATTTCIDMDEVARIAREHKPKLIIAGGTAYPRIIGLRRFREIADEVGAYLMVDMAHFAGLVAGGAHPSPVPARACRDHDHAQDAARPARRHDPDQRRGDRQEDQLGGVPRPAGRPADARDRRQGGRLRRGAAARRSRSMPRTSSRTPRRWRKPEVARARHRLGRHRQPSDAGRPAAEERSPARCAEVALGRAHITCNKNGIPFDPEKPIVTSGVRLGTPAGTTRGFGVAEFRQIGDMIAEVLDVLSQKGVGRGSLRRGRGARQGRSALVARFPIYQRVSTASGGRGDALSELRSLDTQVKDSRPTEDSAAIRRRRVCLSCNFRFTTFERVQLRELTVIKRNGRRVPFDRDKLARSVEIALRKRNVEPERIEQTVSKIVRELESLGESEVTSETIGETVMAHLRELDDVAYVRFASVYRNFREAKDFETALGELSGDEEDEKSPPGRASERQRQPMSCSAWRAQTDASWRLR